ncbi:ATP-dependent exonuclease [Formosa sp. Hel1_33_131]|jgi:hypothetical protein|uniref:DUF3108 domain-containing protein n=1 Tax=Formosa sp. Hel1_33_131 TaxID=1336794 RepID=UPI00084E1AA8|nr:DUF3108 domain-containing protein [Formosa sp. Hel1_33_131]AOR28578.1 ATP-dependent exonuclease [Formosa sp. Hel1_33_131]
MKKSVLILLLFISFQFLGAQESSSFQAGEWLRFKLSYSGWMKAGNATLEVTESIYKNIPVYKVVGKGWTTGPVKWVFKVEDHYESHFDKVTGQPYKFVRNIDEGGYTKNRIVDFDHVQNKALINDLKDNTHSTVDIEQNIQDLVSAYYYLRNNYNTDTIQEGDVVELNIFFDGETFLFKLKYLGRETIDTEFGKIKCIKFRPYVMAGRVFKEEESLTLWVSADKNKVPIKIKADLQVGSLRADLEALKGLKHPFEIQL